MSDRALHPDFSRLPYRPSVGIMLINGDGLVWVGHRIPKMAGAAAQLRWQMPQGGIDEGEVPALAALRELKEEIGTANAQVLGETRGWLDYDFPAELLGIVMQGKYRGQRQKWFAMRFLGADSEIDIGCPDGHEPEFDAWRWARPDELPRLIVAFKRPLYEAILDEFRPLLSRAGAA